MYCYKDEACDTLEKLTDSGWLFDHSDKRMFR